MTTSTDISDFLLFAQDIVRETGKDLKRKKEKIVIFQQKDEVDFSTNLDIEIEKTLIKKIQTKYPTHCFLAEESGGEIDPDKITWVIDPIDGTKEFARGIPIYCIALSIIYKSELLIAAAYNPETDELFSAGKGMGAFLNNKKVQVGKETSLEKAICLFKLPNHRYTSNIDFILQSLKKLAEKTYRISGTPNQNIGLCWVGMNGCDAFINIANADKWWDYAPGILFVQEAGGRVVTLDGHNYSYADKGKPYIAGNDRLVQVVLQLMLQ